MKETDEQGQWVYAPAVRAARLKAGHTQAQAAAVIYYSEEGWSLFERKNGRMRKAIFELYQLKTRQIELADVI